MKRTLLVAVAIGLLGACSGNDGETAPTEPTTATTTGEAAGSPPAEKVGQPFTVAFINADDTPLTDMRVTVAKPVRKGRDVTIKVKMENIGNKPFNLTVDTFGFNGQVVDQNGRTFDGEDVNLATEEEVREQTVTGPADFTFDRLQPGESGVQTLRFKLPEDVEPTTLLLTQARFSPIKTEPIPVSLT
jgi:hypothetical protein